MSISPESKETIKLFLMSLIWVLITSSILIYILLRIYETQKFTHAVV